MLIDVEFSDTFELQTSSASWIRDTNGFEGCAVVKHKPFDANQGLGFQTNHQLGEKFTFIATFDAQATTANRETSINLRKWLKITQRDKKPKNPMSTSCVCVIIKSFSVNSRITNYFDKNYPLLTFTISSSLQSQKRSSPCKFGTIKFWLNIFHVRVSIEHSCLFVN